MAEYYFRLINLLLISLFFGSSLFVNAQRRFPDDFKFGTATSAYQVEGAWNVDGKGPNIWDTLTHTTPEKIVDNSTGDDATKSYYLYERDVEMIKDIDMDFYRFSMSWSRILPNGDISVINELGIDYYHRLIDELIANEIEPMVTMYHWDLPQSMQDLGGWANPLIIDHFVRYGQLLLERFSSKVKIWTTFNEPVIICEHGYGNPDRAPLIYSPGVANYLCGHHLLISHARVYRIYKEQFFNQYQGKVGIVINFSFAWPLDPADPNDVATADKCNDFYGGWWLEPILGTEGGYPPIMIQQIDAKSQAEGRAWSRLPIMTQEIKDLIRGTADYIGINYYTSNFARHVVNNQPSFWGDQDVETSQDLSWPVSTHTWLRSIPRGLTDILNWIRIKYNNPEMIITENGWSDDGELEDTGRMDYYKGHLNGILDAMDDGCNVTGFTAWSIMDNFEWMDGYSQHYGIYHVDFTSEERTRTPKASVGLFREIISTRMVPV